MKIARSAPCMPLQYNLHIQIVRKPTEKKRSHSSNDVRSSDADMSIKAEPIQR